MISSDPQGYYKLLEIAPTASAAEIKAAFRRKVKEYHPDRCKAADATVQMQAVNEAYSVLGDTTKRARYDTSNVETPDTARTSTSQQRVAPSPVVCGRCNKITAQPRYVIFYRSMSFLFGFTIAPVQGVFCSACAEKETLKSTGLTLLLGWWGLGAIAIPFVLFVNLFGGKRPKDINARLLAQQAWYFAAVGQMEIARAVADQALKLALRLRPDQLEYGVNVRAHLDAFIASLPAGSNKRQLTNEWGRLRRPFWLQLAAITLVCVGGLTWLANQPSTSNGSGVSTPAASNQPYTRTPPPESLVAAVATPNDTTSKKTDAMRSAPNGTPWPVAAAYIEGLPQLNSDGHSEVTVDNSQNATNVFVKLVSISGSKAYPVRQFFIPAHGSFVVRNVRAGSYDVRYMDLSSGSKSGTPTFALTETAVEGGIEYSQYSLTLYTVANGNMQVRPLSDDDF